MSMNGLFFLLGMLPLNFWAFGFRATVGLAFFCKADCGLAPKKACYVFFSSPAVRKASASLQLAAFSTKT